MIKQTSIQPEKEQKNRKIVIYTIFYLICFIVLFPFATFYRTLRVERLYNILAYSSMIQIIGGIILLMSAAAMLRSKSLHVRRLLPAILIVIYLLLSLVSSFLAADVSLALYGDWRGEGYLVYLIYVGIGAGAFLVTRYDKKLIKRILMLLVFVSAFFAVIAVIDKYFVQIYGMIYHKLSTGQIGCPYTAFSHNNYYGYYLAMTLIVSIDFLLNAKSKLNRSIFIASTALISVAAIISRCRGAQLAFLVGYVLYILYYIFIRKDKKKVLYLIAIIIAWAAMYMALDRLDNGAFTISLNENIQKLSAEVQDSDTPGTGGSFGARYNMYKATVEIALRKPLLGHGIDNIGVLLEEMLRHTANRCHNELLQKFATIGIPATLAYIAAIGIIFINFIKSIKKQSHFIVAAFFSALIYFGSAQFGVSTPMVAPYFFIMMGIIYAATIPKEEVHSTQATDKN